MIELEILRGIAKVANCKITELFDWIVGTSVGGIFALALVYGKERRESEEWAWQSF